MDKKELLNLVDILKILKSDYVTTCGNMVIGSDINFICLKKLEIQSQLPYVAVNMASLNKSIKEEYDINLFDADINYKLATMFNSMPLIMSALECNGINNDTDFVEANALKTAQGLRYIIRDKYHIPIYNGLLPTVKGDTVDLVIYNCGQYDFLCKFIIHKKKNINLEVYLRCMYMI